MSRTRRFYFSAAVVARAFGVVNYFNLTRPVDCADCFFPYGAPFTFFRDGGFAGGGGIVWSGVVFDLLAVIAVGVALGSVWDRIARPVEIPETGRSGTTQRNAR